MSGASSELQKIDRQGALTQSSLNKLQSTSIGTAGAFKQAQQQATELSAKISSSKDKIQAYSKGITDLNGVIKQSKTHQSALEEQITKTNAQYQKASEKVKELQPAYKAAQKEISAIAKEYGKESAECAKAKEKNQELIDSYGKAKDSCNKYQSEISQLQVKHKQLGANIEQSKDKIVEFKTDINNAEASVNRLSQELALAQSKAYVFGQSMESAGDKIQLIGGKIDKVGSALTLGLTAPILGIGLASVKAGNDFEAQMSRVKAISGATGAEFEKLEQQAIDLGAETSFSASESAEAMENLASAGFNTTEIMAAMPGMLDLAASSGEGLASSADIAASTLRGFGLEASYAGHVADVLAKNAADTNAAIHDTGLAMKYVAPVAHSAGWSLESVTVAIGKMADAGIKGEQAGTTLRGALTRLMKPTEQMYGAMDDLGVSFYDAEGKMKPLSTIVDELQSSTASLTDEQRDNRLATIFGTEALSGMKVLLQSSKPELDKLEEGLKNCDGAANDMAKTMLNNTKGSLEEMSGSLETAGITIQKTLAPHITKAAKGITDLANKFSALDKKGQENILMYVGIAAATGPALKGIGSVTKGVGTLTTGAGKLIKDLRKLSAAKKASEAIGTVGTASVKSVSGVSGLASAISFLTTPVGIAVGAFGLLTAGLIIYGQTQIEISEETKKLISESENLVASSKSIREEIESQRDAHTQNITSIESEIGAQKNLSSRLFDLADKQSKTNGEKALMISLVDELNRKIPELCLQYDQENDKLNMQKVAIDKVIEANKELAKKEAARAQLSEIAETQYKVEQKLYDLKSEQVKISEELAKAQEDYYSAYSDVSGNLLTLFDGSTTRMTNAKTEVDKLNESYKNIQSEIDALDSELTASEKTWEYATQYIENHGDTAEIVAEKIRNGTMSISEAVSEIETRFSMAGTEIPQSFIEAINNAAPNVKTEILALLSEIPTATDETKPELIEKLRSYGIDGVDQLISSMSGKQNETFNVVKSLLSMIPSASDSERENIISKLRNLGIDLSDAQIQAIQDKSPELDEASRSAAQATIDGFNNTIEQNKGDSSSYVGAWATKAWQAFKDTLGIHSPSRVFAESGKDTVEGYNQGVTENQDSSNTVMTSFGDLIKSAFDATKIPEKAKDTGKQGILGFVSGILGVDASTPSANKVNQSTAAMNAAFVSSNLASMGAKYGKQPISAMASAMGANLHLVGSQTNKTAQTVSNGLSGLPADTWGTSVTSGFAGSLSIGRAVVHGQMYLLSTMVSGALSSFPSYSWGAHMAGNFASGINSRIGSIRSAAYAAADAVNRILHHTTPDEGPLKDDDVWGGHMIDNIINSMMGKQAELNRKALSLATGLGDALDLEAIGKNIDFADFSTPNWKGIMQVQADEDLIDYDRLATAIAQKLDNRPILVESHSEISATVEFDGQKIGRVMAPVVSRQITKNSKLRG